MNLHRMRLSAAGGEGTGAGAGTAAGAATTTAATQPTQATQAAAQTATAAAGAQAQAAATQTAAAGAVTAAGVTTTAATQATQAAAQAATAAAGAGDTLEEKLARLEAIERRLLARDEEAVRRQRLHELRSAGCVLTDAQILALAPAVDPGTTEGATALKAFVDANKNLFVPPVNALAQAPNVATAMTEKFKGRRHPELSGEALAQWTRGILGGDQ